MLVLYILGQLYRLVVSGVNAHKFFTEVPVIFLCQLCPCHSERAVHNCRGRFSVSEDFPK
jgi:hypothetical protein